MTNTTITVAIFKDVNKRIKLENSFEYNPSRGFKLAQKLCFWVLRKLKCYSFHETSDVVRVNIDTRDLFKLVQRQIMHLYDMGEKPTKIYIGREEFMQLTKQELGGMNMISFSVENHKQLMGFKVEVLPYMNGVLVV